METYKLKYTGAEIDSKLDAVENKQDKLTAGDGITISEDNTISASFQPVNILEALKITNWEQQESGGYAGNIGVSFAELNKFIKETVFITYDSTTIYTKVHADIRDELPLHYPYPIAKYSTVSDNLLTTITIAPSYNSETSKFDILWVSTYTLYLGN